MKCYTISYPFFFLSLSITLNTFKIPSNTPSKIKKEKFAITIIKQNTISCKYKIFNQSFFELICLSLFFIQLSIGLFHIYINNYQLFFDISNLVIGSQLSWQFFFLFFIFFFHIQYYFDFLVIYTSLWFAMAQLLIKILFETCFHYFFKPYKL